MHFLLVPYGTAGDVYPYVGIGAELRRRHHRVTIITHSMFGDVARRFGLEYVDLHDADAFARMLSHPDRARPMAGFKREADFVLGDLMRKQFAAVAERYTPGATVAVTNHVGYGVRIAHDKLGVPLVSAYVSPFFIRSERRPAAQPVANWVSGFTPLHCMRLAASWLADRYFVDPVLAPAINRFRAELDLPPVTRVLRRWIHSPQGILGLFPRWLAEPIPEDWPPVEFSEFPFFDDVEGAVPDEAEEFLHAGAPPVVFTPGTGVRRLRYFFEAAVTACAALRCRGLLLTRDDEHVPANLPATVRHFRFLPLSQVLPQSAALVSHGGAGTMSQALRAGIPQLVMPMNYDQPEHARRLHKLGVACVLPPRRFRGPAVARALEHLLTNDQVRMRCKALAARMPSGEPCAAACDQLEEFALNGGKPASVEAALFASGPAR